MKLLAFCGQLFFIFNKKKEKKIENIPITKIYPIFADANRLNIKNNCPLPIKTKI